MAVTATASDTLVTHIIRDTGMINPAIMSVSPDKQNLCLGVQQIASMTEAFMPLAESLKQDRTLFKRTIIFCQ
jgi:ATP-dependent DNA helicase RecQ